MNTGRKRILLVEDEALIAMSEQSSLEDYGYDVVTVSTGEKAVALIGEEHSFDLILMDINLGRGIDGTEAAARILAKQEMPVVFLSSHTDPEIVDKTEKITSYGYVVKSSSITVLDASIKMAFKLFEAYKKTKEFNNRLEATFNALPDLLFEVGLDGRYYDVRSSDENLLYKPLPDLIGKRIPELLPPDISSIIMAAIAEAEEQGKSFGRQYELPVPLGRCWFEIAVSRIKSPGKESRFILMCRNISDRKQVEESLHAERQRLAGIIEGTNIGTWEWNVESGETIFNERWAEMLGYTLEELAPISIATWGRLVHPEDLERSASLLERHFAGELPYYECESRVKHKGGHWVWVLDRGKLMSRTPEGKPLIALGTHQDITERKFAELRIKSLLAEKELILKEVHHRIKNNMFMIGSLLTLQASTMAEPAAVAALQDARSRVQSMMVLYEKLYQAQDYNELTLERYLSPLADEIVRNCSQGGAVKLEKRFDDTALDMKRMQVIGIIVNELITNVMKYAFVGRSVGTIRVSAGRVGDEVELSVSDDGVGIPEGVDFEDSGGFGLMLINTLTKQLDGSIRMERDRGTRVALRFKLRDEPA